MDGLSAPSDERIEGKLCVVCNGPAHTNVDGTPACDECKPQVLARKLR